MNVVESMERFRQFLLEFTLEGEDEPLYKSQLEEIHRTQARLLDRPTTVWFFMCFA